MTERPEVSDRPAVSADESSVGGGLGRLPQLAGRRLLVFRIFWSVALLLAVTAPIASFHVAHVSHHEVFLPLNMLGLRGNPDGTLGRPLGSEARAQGVEQGARVLSIDATPLPNSIAREQLAALLNAAPGPVVRLTTRTASGEVRHHRLTRTRGHIEEVEREAGISLEQREIIRRSMSSLAAAAAVVAALLLFFRRPRDPVAALFSIGFLLMAATNGFASTVWNGFDAPPFLGAGVNSLGLAAVGVALITFPHGRFSTRWSRAIAGLIVGWCVFLPINFQYRLISTGLDRTVSVALFMLALTELIVRFQRLPQGIERQQIRWVLFGFAIATFWGAVTAGITLFGMDSPDTFVRTWAGVVNSVALPLIIFSMAFGLLVSLLRYRLYDAEAAISRSAAVTVLTLTLAAVYAGASKGMETYFETTFGREAGAAPGAIGAALAVLLFLPLNSRIQAWAERRFQAPLLRLWRDLPVSLGDMRETSSLADIADETLEELRKGVRSRHSALVLDGQVVATCNIEPAEVAAWYEAGRIERSRTLDCATDDALFPMRLKLRPRSRATDCELGWILLGPRPDGSFFGRDEREVLSQIVDPAARAIEIVQLREEREARLQARFRALEYDLTKLAKREASPDPGSSFA